MPIKIADIKKTHGTSGRLILENPVYVIDDVPKGTVFHAGYSANFGEKLTVEEWENTPKTSLVMFKEISSREKAMTYLDKALFVDEEVLEEISEHYRNTGHILGLEVIDARTGASLGRIEDVWLLPANDVWLCVNDEGELPIPVTDEVIKSVDEERGIVEINVIDGLLEIRNDKRDTDQSRK